MYINIFFIFYFKYILVNYLKKLFDILFNEYLIMY